MALIIEDGSGKSDAQSYVDTTFVDAYFALRGVTYASTDADIINGMDYFEAYYGNNIKGEKLVDTQSLAFPRLIDNENVYPIAIKNAICELAYRAKSATLAPDIERATTKEKVGDIEVEYSEYAPQSTNYALVDMLVMPYLNGSGTAHKISRT